MRYHAFMDIFVANNFSELLEQILDCSFRGKRGTYAHLTRKLSLHSPRTIAMVAKKQRPPSLKLVNLIAQYINASSLEKEFLLLLAEKSRLELRHKPCDLLNQKIQKLQEIKRIAITNSYNLAGIKIEIPAELDEGIKKRLHEILQAIQFDLENSGENSENPPSTHQS